MSATTVIQPSSLEPLAFQSLYRFTVQEYERMAPILEDPRVELIDGYVVNKMPKKPPHIWSVGRLFKALGVLPLDRWTTRKEDPVRIPEFDEPEPDIAVARGPEVLYQDRLPEAEDLALVVEVADSTLDRDRGGKLSAYARARVPIYWIVNLIERQIEVYTQPGPFGYASRVVFRVGDYVPLICDGVEFDKIAVDSILPKAAD